MSEQSSVTDETPQLPQRPKRNRGVLIGLVIVVVAAVVAAVVVWTNRDEEAAGAVTVRIGTTEGSSPYWTIFKDIAAEEGINLEVVNFSDYTQANPALSQSQLDLNLFQHLLFLANYNVSSNDTLTPIESTYVVPLSLYSRKHATVADIPQGGTIAIPNDPPNQARALLVLQKAKLLTLTGGGNALSTPAEIDKANSKVSVTPVDASQTVAALPSVDASIVNNNYANAGGLDPSKALFGDDPSSPEAQPYINVIVARDADKDNPTLQKVARIYKDKRVADAVQAESKGTSVLVDREVTELRRILADLSATVRDAQK